MKFTVVTILPELVEPALGAGVVGRAREAGTITVETINPRDFTHDRHRTVDDTPYGGGPGMVMKPEPLLAAIAAAKAPGAPPSAPGATPASRAGRAPDEPPATDAPVTAGAPASIAEQAPDAPPATDAPVTAGAPASIAEQTPDAPPTAGQSVGVPAAAGAPAGDARGGTAHAEAAATVARAEPPAPHVIYMSPAGRPLTQARVRELAKLPHVVLVCGRYEGIDERVIEAAIDEEISIGDYVLSGGELAALVVIDAVSRYVPGVLGEATSVDEESHSAGLLEYPHYTRPVRLGDREVPPVLLGGNHAAIARWRREQAIARTAARRPDLYERHAPTSPAHRRDVAARTHLALVHHPCLDRTGAVITTALTNFDIHDLARSALTFGLAGYHVVTPITSQREKAAHITTLWIEDAAGEHRAAALRLVRTADSIETVIAELTGEYSLAPVVVGTSARRDAFAGADRRTPRELVAEARENPAPLLVLLGTGWGLAEDRIPSVSRVLTPIEGASTWNHLSVRSAGAILLDRLFGVRSAGPT